MVGENLLFAYANSQKNIGLDEQHGNCAADQCFCFCFIDSIITLLPKSMCGPVHGVETIHGLCLLLTASVNLS